ncbi:MAG: hypothetical protein HZB16_14420 [Armatimonadetes bacterium]|nr:hypothetical protein [Armatimonadota bacterium]
MKADTARHLLHHLRDRHSEEAAKLVRRAQVQMDFARGLTDLLERADWRPLLDEAEAVLAAVDPAAGLGALAAAVVQVEGLLGPVGEVAKGYRLWLVGHGHIDMNWMWSWPETVAATHDTLASVLSLMREYPELTYAQSQASVYAIMRDYFPALFDKIAQRVREGRWEVTASQWVEGDKNLAAGESLCRHLLLTRRAMADWFGLVPEDVPIDWEPDTFGHPPTLPTILAQGGVKYYYSCRQGGGFDHERAGDARPALYWWEAPDGARILVNRETTWYNSYVDIGENLAMPLLAFSRETGLRDWLLIHGIGNHGGGPTRRELDYFQWLRDLPIYPTMCYGTVAGYFAQIADQTGDLPVITGELNFEFTGCYSSQSLIKQANRLGENYLLETEALAAVTRRLTGVEVPAGRLNDGWTRVLFNQFHDILPGSGVRETREHALANFQEVGAICGAAKRVAGTTLAASLDTAALLPDTADAREERALLAAGSANTPFVAGAGSGSGLTGLSRAASGGRRFVPFVVYNPSAWPRTQRVSVSLYDVDLAPGRIVARDEDGHQQPTLLVEKAHDWGHERTTVTFEARDVPGLGYRTYLLCEGDADPQPAGVVYGGGDSFETPFYRVRVGRHHGGLIDLTDKRTGAVFGGWRAETDQVVTGLWESILEKPWLMTAWVLGEEDRAAASMLRGGGLGLQGISRRDGTWQPSGASTPVAHVDWRGAVPGTSSSVRLTYQFAATQPRIDVTAEIDWREIGDGSRGIPGLIVGFPCESLEDISTRWEVPFGSIERALFDGQEVPTLRYAHVAGQAWGQYAGLTLLQDSRYSHAMRGHELRMRVLRSSLDPDHAPEVAKQTLRYSLYLHDTPPTPTELARLGADWNHPLIVFPANLQDGTRPTVLEGARVTTPNVVLTALKKPEDGDGLVLRLVELDGQATEAVVELSAELAAGLRTAQRMDVLERELIGGEIRFDGRRLVVPITAHGLVTVGLV